MKRAVLLSGDADFEPLVDSLIQMGMYVAVSGDAAHTAKDLIRAADAFIPLRFQDYFHLSSETLKQLCPLPVQGKTGYKKEFYEGSLCDRGKLEDGRVVIISLPRVYRAYVPIPNSNTAHTFDDKDPDRLRLFIKLVFGPVHWSSK